MDDILDPESSASGLPTQPPRRDPGNMAKCKDTLDLARKALDALSPIGANRTYDISERLALGYYTSPEVAREVALRLVVDMITPRKPEE